MLGILTATAKERDYISQWKNLKKAGKRVNIEVNLIKNSLLQLSLDKKFKLYYNSKPFNYQKYSVFYNGIGTSSKNAGNFYIPEVLIKLGKKVFNKPKSVELTRNKLSTLILLAENNIPITPSYILRDGEALDNLPDEFKHFPLIVKRIFGSKGKSVVIVKDVFQLRAIFDFAWNFDRNDILLLQKFVGNLNNHSDIRVILLGKKFKSAMLRKSQKGDHRTNFSLNRDVESIILDKKEIEYCEKIANLMDLEYCGVDFIRTDDGPVFLEVNGMPGYTGMNQTYEKIGKNFFEEFILHMDTLSK